MRRPPRSTGADTLCPDTTLVRSAEQHIAFAGQQKRAPGLLHEGCPDQLFQAPHLKRDRRLGAPQRPSRLGVGAEIDHRDEGPQERSEEHTSEHQALMRSTYAVICLNKNNSTISQASR